MANTYPGIDITIKDGALGKTSLIEDGVCGLIVADDLTAATDPVISDGDEFTLTSFDDVEDNGIDQLTFTASQIEEFYNHAGEGAKLYVKCVENYDTSETEENTLTNICDKSHDDAYLKNFVFNNKDDIKFVGVCHNPSENHSPAYTNGFDDTAFGALTKADTYGTDTEDAFYPIFTIIEGRGYQGVHGDLTDLTSSTYDRAGVVIGHSEEGDTEGTSDLSAAVGIILGKIAANSVQRKISATGDGALSVTTMYVPDGDGDSEDVKDHDVDEISKKGYITFRSFIGQNGYYIADDPLANSSTSDFNNITNRRAMDKIIRIAYETYFENINDDVEVDDDGYIDASVIKNLQKKIEDAVNLQMTGVGELSSFSCYINPQQNILSTEEITIKLSPVPKGYLKTIDLEIGFDNPFS